MKNKKMKQSNNHQTTKVVSLRIPTEDYYLIEQICSSQNVKVSDFFKDVITCGIITTKRMLDEERK